MKKLLLLVVLVFGGIATSFSQEASEIAKAQSKKEFVQAKKVGIFEFVMPSNVTEEQVKKSSKYYEKFFKVKFDNNSKKIAFNMAQNDAGSRNILVRFFVSTGVRHISMDGETMTVESFRANYLN